MATGGASLSLFRSLNYWLRWQTPFCLLITVSPAIAALVLLRRRRRRGHLPLPAAAMWAPCFREVPPLVVPVYRGLVVGATTWLLLLRLSLGHGLLQFYFYTQWTFLLVILYFLIGTVISAHGCWVYYCSRQQKTRPANDVTVDAEDGNGYLTFYRDTDRNRDRDDNQTALLPVPTDTRCKLQEMTAGFWGYSMLIIYQICGGAVMLTDVVFWCLLVPFMSSAHFSVNLVMGCMHSLNLLFLLFDALLNSMPFPWFGMTYFILWSCTYVIFQWILHACGFSWWPYPFLELATPWAPLWYFCMALIHVPCYGIYWLIVKAKNTYFPKLFPQSYVNVGLC